jgi:GDPmannose 4,6-dehydratase
VHGIVRRSSTFNRQRIEHLYDLKNLNDEAGANAQFVLHYGDLLDTSSLYHVLKKVKPDEIYHLGAQSHVKVSFEMPFFTADATGMGTLRLLESVRELNLKSRIYLAGSSEMFGKVLETPQKETTPFYPRSPYGISKVFSYWLGVNYREAYQMFVCNGILFNHESPRRGENFVTRKITLGVASIKLGLMKKLRLGNLNAKRDWGFAKDYVTGMWLMLQQDEPEDYVLSTGETHTVQEFCEIAFSHAGLDWKKHVEVDSKYYRPTEVDLLIGDCSKAKNKLGWKHSLGFEDLVKLMVDEDIKYLQKKK